MYIHTYKVTLTATVYMYSADLDNAVVYIDGGHREVVLLGQLVEPVNPCHTLLNNSSHVFRRPRELGEKPVRGVPPVVKDHRRLPPRGLGVERSEVKGQVHKLYT